MAGPVKKSKPTLLQRIDQSAPVRAVGGFFRDPSAPVRGAAQRLDKGLAPAAGAIDSATSAAGGSVRNAYDAIDQHPAVVSAANAVRSAGSSMYSGAGNAARAVDQSAPARIASEYLRDPISPVSDQVASAARIADQKMAPVAGAINTGIEPFIPKSNQLHVSPPMPAGIREGGSLISSQSRQATPAIAATASQGQARPIPLVNPGFGFPRSGSIQGAMDEFRNAYYPQANPQLGLATAQTQAVQQSPAPDPIGPQPTSIQRQPMDGASPQGRLPLGPIAVDLFRRPGATSVGDVQTADIRYPRDLPTQEQAIAQPLFSGNRTPAPMESAGGRSAIDPLIGNTIPSVPNGLDFMQARLREIQSRPGRNARYSSADNPGENPISRYAAGLVRADGGNTPGGEIQGGLATNFGVNGLARSGFVPNRTVGGAFGNPGATPLDFEREQRGPYTPMNQPPIPHAMEVGQSPEYGQAMRIFNPDARWYQGALPAEVTSPSGAVRPGFLAAPPNRADPEDAARGAAALEALGYDRGSRGQFFRSPGKMPDGQAQAMARANEMLRSPERAAYLENRRNDLEGRRALVQENAQNRRELRQHNIGARKYIPNFEDRLAAANPGAYQGRRAMEARMNGIQTEKQADRDLQLGLANMEIDAKRQESADERRNRMDIAKIENGIPLDESSSPATPKIKAAPEVPQAVVDVARKAAAAGDLEKAEQEIAAYIPDPEKRKEAMKDLSGNQSYGDGFWAQPPGTGGIFSVIDHPEATNRWDAIKKSGKDMIDGLFGLGLTKKSYRPGAKPTQKPPAKTPPRPLQTA